MYFNASYCNSLSLYKQKNQNLIFLIKKNIFALNIYSETSGAYRLYKHIFRVSFMFSVNRIEIENRIFKS